MNMILHGVNYSNFDIRQEDTLEKPQHLDKTFDAIVANPPFSAKWSANELHLLDERFSQYGKLAPSSKADFAFIQHMIHHLDENGIMAVVMPHGVLFRGAAELVIRKYLIKEKNYLDAVIGLPANIFFGTSIPTCILVFKNVVKQMKIFCLSMPAKNLKNRKIKMFCLMLISIKLLILTKTVR
jgi:type I restriction enzyme M protein